MRNRARQAETPQQELEVRLGHAFHDRALLDRALTHSSRAFELRQPDAEPSATDDNESMEFLGDAVMGAVVAEWLYRTYPGEREGRLTRMRASVVNRKALAAAAARLYLGAEIHLGRGEEQSGGRNKAALLADTMEAVLAAVYLDGGLTALSPVVEKHILEGGREMLRASAEPDAKSALQEWFQSHHIPKPAYTLTATTGPEHQKQFTITMNLPDCLGLGPCTVQGVGSSKKQAEQECARAALAQLLPAKAFD